MSEAQKLTAQQSGLASNARPLEWTRSAAGKCSIAIVTQQISNYHVARYRAACEVFGKVVVVSAMNDADFREFLAAGTAEFSTVRLFQNREAYLKAVADGLAWTAVHKALDSMRPGVVAVAGWSFSESLATVAWARRHGARVVMMSESQRRDGPRFRLRETVKSRIVTACDAALVGGARQAAYVERLGIPRARVFFGYDAVDNRHFADGSAHASANSDMLRRTHGLPDRYFLASGRFIPKKNFERLVAAFACALDKTATGHSLVILGDGPGRPALEDAIAATGLGSRIVLPGFVSYDDLPIYYGLAECFAHVSLVDQWGLVLNEAAASALPLVASHSCGAAAELIQDGINGYVVDANDVADIARALATVMRASTNQRLAMGMRSRRIVANWGPERFADGLIRAADAALACPPRGLRPWDRAILRILSRRYISVVP